ncbi:MAG TPA: hypothetical protein PLD81_06025 [Elusimicrobiales bacterium]|nr:hypothetical protein [Elusimicrobiales bacterium]HPO95554.1 hypothetical protein [Elusimicrobiales bacterium]
MENKENKLERLEKLFDVRKFWDVDIKKLSPKKSADFVIKRFLEYGSDDEVRSLIEYYGGERVKKVLEKARLSPKSFNYWALKLNLPQKEVLCIKKRLIEKHTHLWRY